MKPRLVILTVLPALAVLSTAGGSSAAYGVAVREDRLR